MGQGHCICLYPTVRGGFCFTALCDLRYQSQNNSQTSTAGERRSKVERGLMRSNTVSGHADFIATPLHLTRVNVDFTKINARRSKSFKMFMSARKEFLSSGKILKDFPFFFSKDESKIEQLKDEGM